MRDRPTFYEFFAGGGMARAGLAGWDCLFANDVCAKKAAAYAANWGADHFRLGDVSALRTGDLPGRADLAWASFPCQDLSLAGARGGMSGATRSGLFWTFWGLMRSLKREGRGPRTIVLENVIGILSSRGGEDFAALCAALGGGGYRFGALVLDAALFTPQSRPRVFFVAVVDAPSAPIATMGEAAGAVGPHPAWHPKALEAAHARLSPELQRRWIWWSPPAPALRNTALADILEEQPTGVAWRSPAETARLLSLMSPGNLAKVEAAMASGARHVGAVYKRIRVEGGVKLQRAEVRFDGLAGCLRTPGGGSSRQTLLIVEGGRVRSRLVSPREAARLMGLPDDYKLPSRYNDAYHLLGDGVCVPAVRHLSEHVLLSAVAVQPSGAKLACGFRALLRKRRIGLITPASISAG
ncbi:MAG: DNA cytosine methyltransferase [Hyphomicrobiales bacterium]|nr:DNA cytosine methyltransferase [Hyphomicrobiales bacterium]